jgi:glycolate oxidase FAD binding subunit
MFTPDANPSPTSSGSEVSDQTQDLAEAVKAASAARTPLEIRGGGTKGFLGRGARGRPLDVTGHRGIVDYEPSELVITARAGTRLCEIEDLLAAQGQMLAFEPPRLGSASTIGGVVAAGLAGPRRPFAGAVRDSVLGARILDGRGEALRFGGSVFKNVAGFDAFRLMAGAFGRLGVLLDVSIRVAPAPRAEIARSLTTPWAQASALITRLMRTPVPLSGAVHDGERLHLRLSGAASAVAAAAADIDGDETPAGLWDALRDQRLPLFSASRLWRLSVPRTASVEGLPGRRLHDWAGAQIWLEADAPADVVRAAAGAAGGHATLWRGARAGEAVFHPLPPPLMDLHRRLAAAFDPAGVFNPGRLYEDL